MYAYNTHVLFNLLRNLYVILKQGKELLCQCGTIQYTYFVSEVNITHCKVFLLVFVNVVIGSFSHT